MLGISSAYLGLANLLARQFPYGPRKPNRDKIASPVAFRLEMDRLADRQATGTPEVAIESRDGRFRGGVDFRVGRLSRVRATKKARSRFHCATMREPCAAVAARMVAVYAQAFGILEKLRFSREQRRPRFQLHGREGFGQPPIIAE